nr:immunoglobulin light chain junction region [Macaca mulatta]
CQQGDGLPFTF